MSSVTGGLMTRMWRLPEGAPLSSTSSTGAPITRSARSAGLAMVAEAQMKTGLLMALESSGARIEQLARQMLAYGRPIPLQEIVAKVDAVTVESARAAGRALLHRGRPAMAAIGPGNGLESAATIAESLARQAA